jgi:hypothetical protein
MDRLGSGVLGHPVKSRVVTVGYGAARCSSALEATAIITS